MALAPSPALTHLQTNPSRIRLILSTLTSQGETLSHSIRINRQIPGHTILIPLRAIPQ